MKTNKNFFAMMAFCAALAAFSFTSCDDDEDDGGNKNGNNEQNEQPAFVKTYNDGLLNVDFGGNDYPSLEDVVIANDAQNEGKYALSIKNFKFAGEVVVGDIDVNNLTAATDAEGNTTLTAEGVANGPEVDMGDVMGEAFEGFVVTTEVTINSCEITSEGVLTLNVSVKLYDKESGDYAGEDMDVIVTFDSSINELPE